MDNVLFRRARKAYQDGEYDVAANLCTYLETAPQDDWPMANPGEDKPTKVAIVGKGPFQVLAPWGEPGWEIWGLNDMVPDPGWPPIHAHTRWFQLHNPAYMRVHYPRGVERLNTWWRQKTGVRLYMDRHYPEYPDSEPYPKDQVEQVIPKWGGYHTSSFDWMVALAVLEGFTHVELWGVEFGAFPYTAGEPVSGRACLEMWCGVLLGRGATLEVGPQESGDLFMTTHLARRRSRLQYGFEREPGLELEDNWEDMR